MDALISVIVPVYKVEPYIHKCVDSIINQTYRNLEIILVDDGSPDNCPAICDEYAKQDDRIEVIHKENGGLSDARNAGLEIATGEYISFIDSDDWVEYGFIESQFQFMVLNDVDIVECGITYVYDKRQEDIISDDASISYSNQGAIDDLIRKETFKTVVWNKLYKKKVISQVMFEVGKINEDEFWTYKVFANAKKIGYLKIPLYNYLQRSDSIMGQYSINRLDYIDAVVERNEFINRKYPELAFQSKYSVLLSLLYHGQLLVSNKKAIEYDSGRRKLNNHMSGFVFEEKEYNRLRKRDRIWYKCAKINLLVTCRIRNLIRIGK